MVEAEALQKETQKAEGRGQKAEMKEQSVVLKPGEQAIAVASQLTTDHSQIKSPDLVRSSAP